MVLNQLIRKYCTLFQSFNKYNIIKFESLNIIHSQLLGGFFFPSKISSRSIDDDPQH
jgi:hypothetical protein